MASNIVQYILNISTSGADKNLKKLNKQVLKTETSMKEMGSESLEASGDLKKLGSSAQAAARKTKDLQLSNKALTGSLAVNAESFLALKDRVIGAISSFVAFAQEQADLINGLNDLSNRSGVSSKAIQSLQFAFEASGQSADSVKGVLDKLPMVLASVDRGTGNASKAFEKLGLSVRNSEGQMKSADKVFEETIIALQQIDNQTQKAAIASEIFGRQAGNMLQALGQTSGLKDFVQFTKEYGADIGPEASNQAAEFQQAIAALNVVSGKLGQTFGLVFGSDGFTAPIKMAGKLIVELTGIIKNSLSFLTSAMKQIESFTSSTLLNLEKDFLVATERIKMALSNLPGVEFDTTESDRRISDIKKQIENLEGGFPDPGKLAGNLSKGFSDIFTNSAKDMHSFERDFDQLVKKLGAGTAAAGSLVIPPELSQDEVSKKISSTIDLPDLKGLQVEVEALELTNFADFNRAFEQAATDLEKAIRQGVSLGIQDSISGGISALAGDGSGVVSEIGSMAGPQGSAAAGIINALADLGKKSPEEIAAEMESFSQAIVNGIRILPDVLIKVLPPMLLKLAFNITKTLLQLPILIGESILEGLRMVIDSIRQWFSEGSERRQERRQERRERRRERRQEWWNDLTSFQAGGRYIKSGQGGLRYTGGNFSGQAGLALLHSGETVVPQSGQMSDSTRRNLASHSGGGGVTINVSGEIIEGNAIDSLVRRIENRFMTFGGSTSPLFNR